MQVLSPTTLTASRVRHRQAAQARRTAPASSSTTAPRPPRVAARAADAKLAAGPAGGDQAAAAAAAVSKCPFLAALPPPPPAHTAGPWQRLRQLSDPGRYQREALGGDTVVAAPAQMGFPEQYVLGRADLVKAAFGGEAAGLTTVATSASLGSRQLLGRESLLVVPEPRHRYLRNLIMPSFSSEAIERLVPRMEAVVDRYLEEWAEAGGPIKAHDHLKRMTFEFIMAVVLGRDYPRSTIKHLSSLYTTWAKGLAAWPFIDLPFTPFGRALGAKRRLLDWFQGAADEARGELAAGRAPLGILGNLVSAVDEHGNRLTDSELGDNLLLLMLAGHDTTSSTLVNAIACLQDNQRVMGELRAEQERLVAARGPAVDGGLLREMTYAEAVISETLRLHNVVSGLMRAAATDLDVAGFRVPAGSILYLPLTHLAATDPRWARGDPQAFRPERMLGAEAQGPGATMPFGHGPRFCAGYAVAIAEMKVFLALLARRYEFRADTNTRWTQAIGRAPDNGLPTTLTRLARPLA